MENNWLHLTLGLIMIMIIIIIIIIMIIKYMKLVYHS